MEISMTLRVIIDVLIGLGVFFAFAGVVGIIRMPDCFCRMQSSTNIATLGLFLALIGGLVYAIFVERNAATAAKIAFIAVIYIIQNPAGGHAIAKAAYNRGNEHLKSVVDDLANADEAEQPATLAKEGDE